MTLLFFDGFDIYGNNGANIASALTMGMWTAAGGPIWQRSDTPAPRTGRMHIDVWKGSGYLQKLVTSTSTMICGVGWYPYNVGLDNATFMVIQNNNGSTITDQVLVGIDTQNRLRIYNASSSAVLAQSAANALTLNAWQFVEVKITAGVSTGEVVARIDEQEVARASGLNTLAGGATIYNQPKLATVGMADNPRFDDFYVCDDKGAVNNDFLGPIEVQTLLPNANGATNDWTPAGASTNVSTVDEAVRDYDTTYVHASTLGDTDLYNVSSLVGGITNVFAVMPVAVVRKENAGANSVRLITRVSTTEASSAVKTVDTTYKFVSEVFETQPGGGAWTPAAVSAMQAGVTIVSTS
jgi:hypothetical protein